MPRRRPRAAHRAAPQRGSWLCRYRGRACPALPPTDVIFNNYFLSIRVDHKGKELLAAERSPRPEQRPGARGAAAQQPVSPRARRCAQPSPVNPLLSRPPHAHTKLATWLPPLKQVPRNLRLASPMARRGGQRRPRFGGQGRQANAANFPRRAQQARISCRGGSGAGEHIPSPRHGDAGKEKTVKL